MFFTPKERTDLDRTNKDAIALASNILQERFSVQAPRADLTASLDPDGELTLEGAVKLAHDLVFQTMNNPKGLPPPPVPEPSPPPPAPAPPPAESPSGV
ncbi:MAG TPA: hypothetical protein PLH48_17955 [Acinetobacter johnsonii]|nr:hypothetical protein [Acinetobacter johnsonii]